MKKLISILSLALVMLASACGGGGGVTCSPEMTAFMADLKGKSDDVSAALTKYAANDSIDRKDMDMYDLSDASFVSCETKDGKKWCTMEAKAGITVRTYVLCWEGGKITSVEDKGMK